MSNEQEISAADQNTVAGRNLPFGHCRLCAQRRRAGGSYFRNCQFLVWGCPLEWAAAWCSLKIILLSVGLFLVVDVLGTVLLWLRRKELAMVVFLTQIVSVFVFGVGGYYLLKALF